MDGLDMLWQQAASEEREQAIREAIEGLAVAMFGAIPDGIEDATFSVLAAAERELRALAVNP